MAYVISIINMKGGVSKTTITVNLAACLARDYGKRVLIVDLDTQVNATLSLMPPLHFAKLKEEELTLKRLINQGLQPSQTKVGIEAIIQTNICQIPKLDLLPGDLDLYNDLWLATVVYGQSSHSQINFEKTWNLIEDNLIRDILAPVKDIYDFILIDFSPADNLITRSGILASNLYLIPAKPEPLSVVGIGMLESRVARLKKSKRSEIKLLGIALTSLGRATNMAAKIQNRLAADFGKEQIFQTEIPLNVDVAKAVDYFRPVVINSTQSKGAKAFTSLTAEFMQRLVVIG